MITNYNITFATQPFSQLISKFEACKTESFEFGNESALSYLYSLSLLIGVVSNGIAIVRIEKYELNDGIVQD